jgi:hypothetical protein
VPASVTWPLTVQPVGSTSVSESWLHTSVPTLLTVPAIAAVPPAAANAAVGSKLGRSVTFGTTIGVTTVMACVEKPGAGSWFDA